MLVKCLLRWKSSSFIVVAVVDPILKTFSRNLPESAGGDNDGDDDEDGQAEMINGTVSRSHLSAGELVTS